MIIPEVKIFRVESKDFSFSSLILSDNLVNIYIVSLDKSPFALEYLSSILSEDERKRSDRYKFLSDKNKFIIARGMLRIILSQYLDIQPDLIKFDYTDRGKPTTLTPLPPLPRGEGEKLLSFNLSHSQQLAVYAISLNQSLGIDLEYLGKSVDCEPIAKRFFTQKEYECITGLNEREKKEAFFRLWTKKEAYLKAIAQGIANGLDQVEFDLKLNIMRINGSEELGKNWFIYEFSPEKDYISNLTIKLIDN